MDNKRYKVEYEFKNELGRWMPDDLTNNGAGFTREDARDIALQISENEMFQVRNVRVVLMWKYSDFARK